MSEKIEHVDQEYFIFPLIVSLIVSVAMILVLFTKLKKVKTNLFFAEWDSRALETTIAADLSPYIDNVIKDIATELIERDSAFYINNLSKLQVQLSSLKVSSQEQNSEALARLSAKYPMFVDFDECRESWPHILRSESFVILSNDELAELFNDIRSFSVLRSQADESWRHNALVSDLEVENAVNFARQLEDTVLLRQLKFVEKLYYPVIYDAEISDDDWLIASQAFKVKRIWPEGYEMESCFGVYFPDLDVYGSFTIFYHDDRHVSFYRSNSSFSELESLDTLSRYGDFSDTRTIIIERMG
ncbi:MAG: hypothetical protein HWE12_07785 [Oceanospirillaceae bacterium]|nr:hypothetical protein [Oceanospirillaceae bacterium]